MFQIEDENKQTHEQEITEAVKGTILSPSKCLLNLLWLTKRHRVYKSEYCYSYFQGPLGTPRVPVQNIGGRGGLVLRPSVLMVLRDKD